MRKKYPCGLPMNHCLINFLTFKSYKRMHNRDSSKSRCKGDKIQIVSSPNSRIHLNGISDSKIIIFNNELFVMFFA